MSRVRWGPRIVESRKKEKEGEEEEVKAGRKQETRRSKRGYIISFPLGPKVDLSLDMTHGEYKASRSKDSPF